MSSVGRLVGSSLGLALTVVGCTAAGGTGDASRSFCDEGAETPIAWCEDRADDDCDDVDEACPATQPADAAPAFGCGVAEDPPDNVLFWATPGDPTNEQVASSCVFVYQGASGAFYAAVSVVDGPDPTGPPGADRGLCAYDYSARKHLFFTQPRVEDCEEVAYLYPDDVANQVLSTSCRKMVRNLARDDGDFDPDIQFLPGDLDVQRARIALFSEAEIACLRINNNLGNPYRTDEIFVTQAHAPLVENLGFVALP